MHIDHKGKVTVTQTDKNQLDRVREMAEYAQQNKIVEAKELISALSAFRRSLAGLPAVEAGKDGEA